jgi:hypothetical protein
MVAIPSTKERWPRKKLSSMGTVAMTLAAKDDLPLALATLPELVEDLDEALGQGEHRACQVEAEGTCQH